MEPNIKIKGEQRGESVALRERLNELNPILSYCKFEGVVEMKSEHNGQRKYNIKMEN